MTKKVRVPIPREILAEVLFQQDHTCCICRQQGLEVQVHHINEDPSDNSIENLAVLCLHDHDRTMQRGGFGRQLTAGEVIRYRDDWLERVRARRDDADKLAAATMGTAAQPVGPNSDKPSLFASDSFLANWLSQIIDLKKEIYLNARPKWDTGISVEMNVATYDVLEVLQVIWSRLAEAYPTNHFGGAPEEYVNKFVFDRIRWHRAVNLPAGEGTEGTIIGQLQAGGAMQDLSDMIAETVCALVIWRPLDFDIAAWQVAWDEIH